MVKAEIIHTTSWAMMIIITLVVVTASETDQVQAKSQNISAKSLDIEGRYNSYNDYDNYGSTYAGLYHDYEQGVRDSRILDSNSDQTSASKVKFPVDEAQEHLVAIHQDYNAAQDTHPPYNRANGARGLFPFNQNADDTLGKNGFYGVDPAPSNDPYSINNFKPQEESFEELIRKQRILALQQHETEKKQQAQMQLQSAHYQNLLGQNTQNQFLTGESPAGVGDDQYKLYLQQAQKQYEKEKIQQYLQSQEQQQQMAETYMEQQKYQQQLQQEQQYQQFLNGGHGQSEFNQFSQAGNKPPPPKPIKSHFTNPYEQSYNGQSPFVSQPAPVYPHESAPSGPPSSLTGTSHLPSEGFFSHPTEGEIYLGSRPPTSSIHSQPHAPFKPIPPSYGGGFPYAQQPSPYQPGAYPSQGASPYPQSSYQSSPYQSSPYQPNAYQPNPYPSSPYPHQQQESYQNYLQQIGDIGGIAGASNYPDVFNQYKRRQDPDTFSRRISRAIEEISRNDDLECVPKLVCQMVGSRMSNRPLPGFIDSGSLGTLIQSIPVETPSAVYIRAALLGVTSRRCDGAYSRCPRSEDDVLYYLNNHRGGFFKFFGGEDNTLDVKPHKGQQQSQYQDEELSLAQLFGQSSPQGGQSGQLNLFALQNIAAALTQNGQGSFGTPQRDQYPQVQRPQPSGGFNLASLGSGLNILSTLAGFFGNGGRSLARSTTIESNATDTNHTLTYEEEVEELKDIDVPSVIQALVDSYKKIESEKPTTDIKETKKKISKRSIETTPKGDSKILGKIIEIEPRIVNRFAEYALRFPPQETNRKIPQLTFFVTPAPPSQITPVRHENLPMKTGTGNLVFDSDQFHKNRLNSREEQIKAILKLLQDEEESERDREDRLERLRQHYTNTHRLTGSKGGQYYRPSYTSSYQQTYSQPNYNRVRENHEHKIYVTNSQGQTEYYIDTTNGQKYYVK